MPHARRSNRGWRKSFNWGGIGILLVIPLGAYEFGVPAWVSSLFSRTTTNTTPENSSETWQVALEKALNAADKKVTDEKLPLRILVGLSEDSPNSGDHANSDLDRQVLQLLKDKYPSATTEWAAGPAAGSNADITQWLMDETTDSRPKAKILNGVMTESAINAEPLAMQNKLDELATADGKRFGLVLVISGNGKLRVTTPGSSRIIPVTLPEKSQAAAPDTPPGGQKEEAPPSNMQHLNDPKFRPIHFQPHDGFSPWGYNGNGHMTGAQEHARRVASRARGNSRA